MNKLPENIHLSVAIGLVHAMRIAVDKTCINLF